MSNIPPAQEIAQRWISKAEADWRAGELLRQAKPRPEPALAAFHHQHCVEKYLKAILTFLSVDYPRTHDLSRLLQLCPPALRREMDSQNPELLNPFAVEVRYPLDLTLDSAEACARAATVASSLRQIILRWLAENFPP